MTAAELLAPYRLALLATLGVGFLFLAQTAVGFAARWREKHPGGLPIEGGHERWLFRADRARCNTFEVLGVYAVAVVAAMSLGGPAAMVNTGAAIFFAARVAHTGAYYANLQLPRSLAFVAGNVGVFVLLAAGVRGAL